MILNINYLICFMYPKTHKKRYFTLTFPNFTILIFQETMLTVRMFQLPNIRIVLLYHYLNGSLAHYYNRFMVHYSNRFMVHYSNVFMAHYSNVFMTHYSNDYIAHYFNDFIAHYSKGFLSHHCNDGRLMVVLLYQKWKLLK